MSIEKSLIFCGLEGSGKLDLSHYLSEKFNMNHVQIGNKVDDIRNLIEQCVALTNPTIFYIDKADSLTTQAQNALLKIYEEPPNNCFIILGVENLQNVLGTIKSRAKIKYMPTFTYVEMDNVYHKEHMESCFKDELIRCTKTPGRMRLVVPIFDDVYRYSMKVFDNILKVSTGNSFKICNNISFKDGDSGVDMKLFLECFLQICINDKEWRLVSPTVDALQKLTYRGLNKKLIFDVWVLDIRRFR